MTKAATAKMGRERTNDVGLVGLGVMGGPLARNLAAHGLRVAGHDRNPERAKRLVSEHPEAGLERASGLQDLVGRLARPRRLLLLVPAGGPVDDVLDGLDPLLEEGDLVVDGGNSHCVDTERRFDRARDRPWHFVGMGISGGAEGALHGPSMMFGGEPGAWETLRDVLERVAARSDSGPCVAWCGHRSAGHFVKMVHNGIEYAEMQHLAEAVTLLRRGLGLEAAAVADLLEGWNEGPLESFLVAITARILRTPDPRHPGSLLLDGVLDRAGQHGTGRWAARAALELGVAVPSIAAAVDARVLSAQIERRRRGAERLDSERLRRLEDVSPGDVQAALLGARIAALAQGFELLAKASREHGYETDLATVARIWKAGCILRARLLDDVEEALRGQEASDLLLEGALAEPLREGRAGWRRVVAGATRSGLALPGLATALGWLETLSTARGSAALIQAQRDLFGAHGFERVEGPGQRVHSDWLPEG